MFSAFKRKLREFLNQVQGDTGAFTIDKFAALRVVGLAWSTCNFEINIQAGFRACGLYPLSSSRMFECLSNFKQNGAGDVKLATWLKYKDTVQDDILVLPAPRKKSRQRTTVTVGGKLLTAELIAELAASKKTAKQPAKTTTAAATTESPSATDSTPTKRRKSATTSPATNKKPRNGRAQHATLTRTAVVQGAGGAMLPRLGEVVVV